MDRGRRDVTNQRVFKREGPLSERRRGVEGSPQGIFLEDPYRHGDTGHQGHWTPEGEIQVDFHLDDPRRRTRHRGDHHGPNRHANDWLCEKALSLPCEDDPIWLRAADRVDGWRVSCLRTRR